MSFADRGDLFEMMPAVDELKHSPLASAERTQASVTGAAGVAEESLGFPADSVKTCDVLGCGLDEFIA